MGHIQELTRSNGMTLPIPAPGPVRLMRLCALASGSKGNCIYVDCGETRLLIDCGITMSGIAAALKQLSAHSDAPVTPCDLSAILVTHEHSDHIKSCASMARRHDLPVYASAPTLSAINMKAGERGISMDHMRAIRGGEDFYIGDIDITPFDTPHDAAGPLGYRLDAGAASIAIATDIGVVSDRWMHAVEGAQLVLLEANHDEAMLRSGPYPAALKRRILSNRGHLSNMACARAAVQLARSGTRMILLSHLSENNNTPQLAYHAVCEELRGEGIRPGEDVYVGLLRQDQPSSVFELECE